MLYAVAFFWSFILGFILVLFAGVGLKVSWVLLWIPLYIFSLNRNEMNSQKKKAHPSKINEPKKNIAALVLNFLHSIYIVSYM